MTETDTNMTDHATTSSDAVPVSPASNSEPKEHEEQGEGEPVERHNDDDDAVTMMIPHLYILPPRPTPLRSTDHVVALPPLRPDEQVQSIRVALMDVRTYAHYTSYRLELEIIPDRTKITEMMMNTGHTDPDPNRENGTATSLTGKDADICIPVQYLPSHNNTEPDTIVLDDYGDLQVIGQHLSKLSCSSSLSSSDSDNMIVGLRIVLERYNISSLREHILRCKYLLTSGQLPTITTLFEVPTNESMELPTPPSSDDPTEGKDHTDTTAVITSDAASTTTSDPVDSQSITTTAENSEIKVTSTTTSTIEAEKSSITLPDLHTTPNIVVDGSNIQDYFYLTFGEDREVLHRDVANSNESHFNNGIGPNHKTPKSHKKKGKHHKNGHDKNVNGTATTTPTATLENGNDLISHTIDATTTTTTTATTKQLIQRYNELDELSRCTCNVIIQYSGYHPPPNHRKLLGDLAYFMITIPKTSHHDSRSQKNEMSETSHPGSSSNSSSTIVQITCTASGFYLNQTVDTITFNPAPAIPESHFSHTLLDCLLSVSSDFRQLWTTALNAAKERNEMPATAAATDTTSMYPSILRAAIRGDFDGFRSNFMAVQIIKEAYDAAVASPTWLVPSLTKYTEKQDQQQGHWNQNACHCYSQQRTEDELQRTYGILENVRSGTITRDWNEELQIAREMPVSTSQERLERARMIHKVMMEFGEASLHGVMAISNGHVLPMNPNESIRSQVFLINNIFVSRGVDTGPETFKITRGDRAARKASNRDLQCISFFYRMDSSSSNSSNRATNLHTLATVLIDYLGTRYVCQSILPGILIGDKSHTLLYGSVDAGAPLKFDDDLEKTLEEKLGQNFMIARRPIYRSPLSAERIVEIEQQRKPNAQMYNNSKTVSNYDLIDDKDDIIRTCVAVEAKGILGSDQRRYMLDISRLTPRDANWVPKEEGGTGKYEEIQNWKKEQKTIDNIVPMSLNDDEWVMCVLRPELITRYTQVMMKQFIDGQSKDKVKGEAETQASTPDEKDEETAEQKEEAATESNGADTTAYLQSLKFNVNVFIPHIRAITDTAIAEQIKEDETMVRDISSYLWDDVLPKITAAIREGAVNQLPVDGKSLTEFLHRNGVNCRYLGRLALLAHEQEAKDIQVEAELKLGKRTTIERKTMPRCWLEMLECEMVARAAKHVLDEYLTSNGGVAALQPAQTIASFLSALVSEAEETAAQTETRNSKRRANEADDDDYAALKIANIGGNGDAITACIKSRSEVWRDIEIDIGRRFRYSLTIFNRGNKSHRTLYIPLLRRVCQRTGVILSAKKYAIGGKCLCGSSLNGRLMPSFPISPLDVVDVVPLMKHTAAYNEGFQLCSVGTTAVCLPPLQISFPDARATLERAHIQTSCRALGRALELAQEAGSLYQRVTDNAAHPGVIESIDLMATIFFEAGDTSNAVANAEKALTLTLQSGGLDSAAAFNAHQLLFQMLFTAHDMERAIKHIRASMYILELMAGPRHTEQYSAYHKLGTVYSYAEYNGRYLEIALECFREACNRESCDRLMDGFMAKNFARTLLGLENFVDALDYERKANHTLTMFLGKNHKMVLESDTTLKVLSALAVEKGNKGVVGDAKSNQTNTRPAVEDSEAAAIADSIAADLLAEEERSNNKKKGDKKKRGKK